MSYTPFIASAYAIGTVILTWVALAPVFNKKKLMQQLKARQARMERAS